MFPHLFAPGRIGSLTLKNRIVLSAMGSHQAEADGTVTEGAIRYYARRARGGAALVTVEATTVHPTGRIAHATDLSEDRFIPNLARLANAVHDAGARASIQLY
ncbi:MAG: NADH oxidase, partial [Clostridia bacterium]|nr:NADH oxidase [Clostridia bacterium]